MSLCDPASAAEYERLFGPDAERRNADEALDNHPANRARAALAASAPAPAGDVDFRLTLLATSWELRSADAERSIAVDPVGAEFNRGVAYAYLMCAAELREALPPAPAPAEPAFRCPHCLSDADVIPRDEAGVTRCPACGRAVAALFAASAPAPAGDGWRRIVYPSDLDHKRDAASLPLDDALIVLWDGNYYLGRRVGETFEYDDGSASQISDMDGALWLRVPLPPAPRDESREKGVSDARPDLYDLLADWACDPGETKCLGKLLRALVDRVEGE